jgi:hypothetical protein
MVGVIRLIYINHTRTRRISCLFACIGRKCGKLQKAGICYQEMKMPKLPHQPSDPVVYFPCLRYLSGESMPAAAVSQFKGGGGDATDHSYLEFDLCSCIGSSTGTGSQISSTATELLHAPDLR